MGGCPRCPFLHAGPVTFPRPPRSYLPFCESEPSRATRPSCPSAGDAEAPALNVGTPQTRRQRPSLELQTQEEVNPGLGFEFILGRADMLPREVVSLGLREGCGGVGQAPRWPFLPTGPSCPEMAPAMASMLPAPLTGLRPYPGLDIVEPTRAVCVCDWVWL